MDKQKALNIALKKALNKRINTEYDPLEKASNLALKRPLRKDRNPLTKTLTNGFTKAFNKG